MRRRNFRSVLEDIPGVGEGRKKALLRAFGSLKRIREASIEELAAQAGLGTTLAERIHAHLHASADELRREVAEGQVDGDAVREASLEDAAATESPPDGRGLRSTLPRAGGGNGVVPEVVGRWRGIVLQWCWSGTSASAPEQVAPVEREVGIVMRRALLREDARSRLDRHDRRPGVAGARRGGARGTPPFSGPPRPAAAGMLSVVGAVADCLPAKQPERRPRSRRRRHAAPDDPLGHRPPRAVAPKVPLRRRPAIRSGARRRCPGRMVRSLARCPTAARRPRGPRPERRETRRAERGRRIRPRLNGTTGCRRSARARPPAC